MSAPTIIYADPIRALAGDWRQGARQIRDLGGDENRAAQLERMAERLEAAIEAGASATWVPLADAALLLKRHPETIRVRCRKVLATRGMARKVGGDWQVHVSALAA